MSGLEGMWLTSMKSTYTHTHIHGHGEGILCSIFSLILSPQLLLSSSLLTPLSLCHSPSFTLSIFHPLHPNYWCHCKLNCCNRIAAFPLNSPNRHLLQWKWSLFPSANFQVCVMGDREENAGWLPPLFSLDSRPIVSNILLFCLSLWVLCDNFSISFLFIL